MNTTNLTFIESTLKMPIMHLPVRSVVVTVGANKILISPGSRLTDQDYQGLSGITDIVAPNHFHAAGVPKAVQYFPKARVWAPPGLMAKRPTIQWTGELNEKDWPYQKDLPIFHLKGMPQVSEVVFVHPESQSLIVCDLVFNMKNVKGAGAWLIQTLFGTRNRFAMSRFFARFIKDKFAFSLSVEKLFGLDFNQVIVSHGHNIEGDVKTKLREALRLRGY